MGLTHGLVHALAQTEVICIHYNSLVHWSKCKCA
jgi:hypothetical protein